MDNIDWHEAIQNLMQYTHEDVYATFSREWIESVLLDRHFVDAHRRSIYNWLKDNIEYHDTDWQVFYERETVLFKFKIAEDRALFALRWMK